MCIRDSALTSVLLPYCVVFFLGAGLLGLTLVSISLEAMALTSIVFMQWHWSLGGLSTLLLYLLGLSAETIILSAIYYVVPVGRTAWHHAVIGGFFTASLWEVIRHLLVWYFATFSRASIVYGSLTTAVVALFSICLLYTSRCV